MKSHLKNQSNLCDVFKSPSGSGSACRGPSCFSCSDGLGKEGGHNARNASHWGGGGDSREREVAAMRIP